MEDAQGLGRQILEPDYPLVEGGLSFAGNVCLPRAFPGAWGPSRIETELKFHVPPKQPNRVGGRLATCVKSRPRDRFPPLGRGAILAHL